MKLTRRDAIAALAAVGTAGAAIGYGEYRSSLTESETDTQGRTEQFRLTDEEILDIYVAVAEVVYPTAVSGIEEFVQGFVPPRLDREKHGAAMRETAVQLDDYVRQWQGRPFSELSRSVRDQQLRRISADTADEAPEGTFAERVRFYLVNELLLALYTSPTGGKLIGIENPQGHPGGTVSYQRGPSSDSS